MIEITTDLKQLTIVNLSLLYPNQMKQFWLELGYKLQLWTCHVEDALKHQISIFLQYSLKKISNPLKVTLLYARHIHMPLHRQTYFPCAQITTFQNCQSAFFFQGHCKKWYSLKIHAKNTKWHALNHKLPKSVSIFKF